MAPIPKQPTYNLQDDLSPGTSKGGVTSSPPAGLFGIANRSVEKGGTLPAYPSDSGTERGSGPG
jgi:hypothetical protein